MDSWRSELNCAICSDTTPDLHPGTEMNATFEVLVAAVFLVTGHSTKAEELMPGVNYPTDFTYVSFPRFFFLFPLGTLHSLVHR